VAGNTTTLYISDTSIRLMVTRGRRVSKLAEAPLDAIPSDANHEIKEAELAGKIKQLFEANKVNTKKIVVGISGLHCLSRPAVLPQLPKMMQEEAVIREARRVLPVPLEQLYLSWQIIASTEEKIQVFMVAIPRHIADSLLRVLHEVGLKPYLMDIKPLALARLSKEATAIIIDVQPSEFDIVIVTNGVPQPIRTVPYPEEIMDFQDKLSLVKDELYRTIQFYNSNNPEQPVDATLNIYVSGELADEPESYEAMAEELGYNILPLTSPLKCPKQLDTADHLVNIGLALKELPREAGPLLPNLNMLPVQYQSKPLSLTKLIAIPVAAIAFGLIVMFAMTIQDAAANIGLTESQVESTNFIIDQKQAQKKELEENIATLERKLANSEAERENIKAAIVSLNASGEKINGNLETLVDEIVDGIKLSSISHAGKGISLSGKATSEVEILQYARNLDSSGRFAEITIASISCSGSETQEGEIEDDEVVDQEEDEDDEIEDEEEDEEIEEEEAEEEETEDTDAMSFTILLRLKETE